MRQNIKIKACSTERTTGLNQRKSNCNFLMMQKRFNAENINDRMVRGSACGAYPHGVSAFYPDFVCSYNKMTESAIQNLKFVTNSLDRRQIVSFRKN